jgi:hypothetical protein
MESLHTLLKSNTFTVSHRGRSAELSLGKGFRKIPENLMNLAELKNWFETLADAEQLGFFHNGLKSGIIQNRATARPVVKKFSDPEKFRIAAAVADPEKTEIDIRNQEISDFIDSDKTADSRSASWTWEPIEVPGSENKAKTPDAIAQAIASGKMDIEALKAALAAKGITL